MGIDMEQIKIGDKFWQHDSNRRRYDNGKLIPECSYFQIEIVGETRVSWVDNEGNKHPKKNPFEKRYGGWGREYTFLTTEQKDSRLWAARNVHKIVDHVRKMDGKDLKNMAEYLGICEETPK